MPKQNSTEIVFIVDRSGSMASIAPAMSQGFDELIHKQRLVPGECVVTATQFDDQYEVLYIAKPLAEVPAYQLVPRGNTALLDAIGRTISTVGQRLDATKEEDRPAQVIVVILTDGYENASQEYTRQRVFDMIRHQRTKYAWQFVFLGANQDAIAVGNAMGVTQVATFSSTPQGAAAAYRSVSNSVTQSRTSGSPVVYSQANYDAALKSGQD